MSRFHHPKPLFLPMILAPVVLLSPVLFTGKALFWGTPYLQFTPWRWAAWEMIRSGHLPLWNPEVGMGAPLAANYQSALFYPPNWISFLLASLGGVGWLAWGQALLVALHLIWASLGMSRLAKQLGMGELAQVVSGLAFGLSGYLVARSGFLSINAAVAWVPWVILSLNLQPFNLQLSTILKLSVVLALQLLAGHAQTFWYTLLLAGMWVGFACWNPVSRTGGATTKQVTGGLSRVIAAWSKLGLALAFALALAAVQLLPTAEYLRQSQRAASIGYDFAMTYSFWPWRFLTLVAPGLFGSPARGDYWGYGNYWEDAVYIGMLPVLLAVSAIVGALRGKIADRRGRIADRGSQTADGETRVGDHLHSALTPFLGLLVLLSFILALGKNSAIFPWLYRHVPTFDMFQAPTRFSLWAEFGLALLVGIGVDHWRRPAGRGLYWTRLGTAGAFAITLGAGIAWWFLGDISPTFLRATALSGMWAMGAGVLCLLAPVDGAAFHAEGSRRPSPWIWAVILFVSIDLLLAGWGLNPGTGTGLYTQPSSNAEAVRSMSGNSRIFLPEEDEYRLKFDRFFGFESFDPGEGWSNLRSVYLPDANLLDHLPSVNNFDPLVPGRYSSWMDALKRANPEIQERLLNLMDVGVVVKVDEQRETGVRLETRQGGRRLRWVPCAHATSTAVGAFVQLFSSSFDPDRETVVEAPEAGQGPVCPAGGTSKTASNAGIANARIANARIANARIALVSVEPNRLVARLNAEAGGWLVLSDVWYPGWQARVDGKPATLAKANYLFRAVPVPAGAHEVTFVYRPLSFFLGAGISLAAWALLAGFFMLRRLPKSLDDQIKR